MRNKRQETRDASQYHPSSVIINVNQTMLLLDYVAIITSKWILTSYLFPRKSAQLKTSMKIIYMSNGENGRMEKWKTSIQIEAINRNKVKLEWLFTVRFPFGITYLAFNFGHRNGQDLILKTFDSSGSDQILEIGKLDRLHVCFHRKKEIWLKQLLKFRLCGKNNRQNEKVDKNWWPWISWQSQRFHSIDSKCYE